MNIKQAEHLSGVSRQNIRFYEKQGLLAPSRNPENDYRTYTEADIQNLKWIRAMRMLDMPLEDIRQVLSGSMSLAQAASAQQERLQSQVEKLEGAIRFCGTLQNSGGIQHMDVDACLAKMAEVEDLGYFRQWKQDFLAIAAAEHQRLFTFTPDSCVTNPREFTDALLAYAQQEGLDLVITKESMYPEFTIDGIEYSAVREYHRGGGYGVSIPVATIRCEMTHPEEYAPPISRGRSRFLRFLNGALPGIVLFVVIITFLAPDLLSGGMNGWEIFLLLVATGSMIGVGTYLNWRYHFNDKTK